MKKKKRLIYIAAGVLLCASAVATVFIFSVPQIHWRARVIVLKLQGEIPDLGWSELLRMLKPGGPYYIESIVSTKNPYTAIANPYTSDAHIASGADIFRSHCATCHGADGTGAAGPSLTQGNFRHGESDWGLFRTISRGIPGTAMVGGELSEKATWQVVAFVRSLSKTSVQPGPISSLSVSAVTYDRLRRADEDSSAWLTYSGNYRSHRFSRLGEITRRNVRQLRLKWAFQMETSDRLVEATPLVIDQVMYVTEPPNNVLALDTRSGRLLWSYRRKLPDKLSLCCGRVNRGVAILGDKVYLGTLDAHLVALDSSTGAPIWDVQVADAKAGYTITSAPLAIDGKVVLGVAGGEFGVRGFLDAYDATTGRRMWRFYTVPGPGEPGHETWAGRSWETGGAPTWLTGAFDHELNLIYWGVGNPAPTFQGDGRAGDNLYSNSLIAVDAGTGKLKWHFQFTPHDEHDWDSTQIPVLLDASFRGKPRKLLLLANRNAFYYVLDRETGEFLLARPFAKQTWAEGIDAKGRAIARPESVPSTKGTLVWPGVAGATNWWSPSYSPLTHLFYVPILERSSIFFKGVESEYTPGQSFEGSVAAPVTNTPYWSAVRALAPETGDLKWEHRFPSRTHWAAVGGLLSTAGKLIFVGDDNIFYALDAETGRELWRVYLGGIVHAAPITYLSDGHQQVSVAAGRALFTFGFGEKPASTPFAKRESSQ